MKLIKRIDAYAAELTDIRRDLHAHPELGFEEVRTSGVVAELLQMPRPPKTVADAVARTRCVKCRTRSVKEFRISYESDSFEALRGAEQGRD